MIHIGIQNHNKTSIKKKCEITKYFIMFLSLSLKEYLSKLENVIKIYSHKNIIFFQDTQ